jgi:AcrR family transcriptional regulator
LDEARQEVEGRIRRATLQVVASRGVTGLLAEEVADRAEVSRATLYRIYGGRRALLEGAIGHYPALDWLADRVAAVRDEPPEVAMPAIAVAARRLSSDPDGGAYGMLMLHFWSQTPHGEGSVPLESLGKATMKIFEPLQEYIAGQMALGRLRATDPVLALQAFIGPVLLRLLPTRWVGAGATGGVEGEESFAAIAELWLRAMAPETPLR